MAKQIKQTKVNTIQAETIQQKACRLAGPIYMGQMCDDITYSLV